MNEEIKINEKKHTKLGVKIALCIVDETLYIVRIVIC